jgi:hypothetical protein
MFSKEKVEKLLTLFDFHANTIAVVKLRVKRKRQFEPS